MIDIETIVFLSGILCMLTILSIGISAVKSEEDIYREKEKIRKELMREIYPLIFSYMLRNKSVEGGGKEEAPPQYAEKNKSGENIEKEDEKDKYGPLGIQLFYKENDESTPEKNSKELSVPSLVYGDPSKVVEKLGNWWKSVTKYEVEKSDFEKYAKEKYRERIREIKEITEAAENIHEKTKGVFDVAKGVLECMEEDLDKYGEKLKEFEGYIKFAMDKGADKQEEYSLLNEDPSGTLAGFFEKLEEYAAQAKHSSKQQKHKSTVKN